MHTRPGLVMGASRTTDNEVANGTMFGKTVGDVYVIAAGKET